MGREKNRELENLGRLVELSEKNEKYQKRVGEDFGEKRLLGRYA
ncbi:hypothetical protein HMPREF1320_0517 [Capnocytophaga sp. oral taxon 335 str. F0486]|nr:hypothetical protein HMPREF1320_0517 [Capnocytophaga sp. oral taxon 335 str. F0486]